VSDAEGDVREVRILHEAGLGRKMECPECGHLLPPDGHTECDRCGAHLELMVRVHAPGRDT
jgi:DNA-directed RNA polymerase subunit RPC12/RpoP